MSQANRRDMIRAFGRGHDVRYDESTATRLSETAALANERYGGDLSRLAAQADGDVTAAARLLKEFKGIGDTGLSTDADELAALAPRANADLAAALIRVSRDDNLRKQLMG